MTWGITCYAQDEKLCSDPDCVRNDCKLTRSSAATEHTLLPCPFCGNELYRSPRTHNPKAYCVTEDCYGKRMSVVNLDDPVCVAMWNSRSVSAAQPAVVSLDKSKLDAAYEAYWANSSGTYTSIEAAILSYLNASQPSPAAPVETEEWEEVTDGTTKPGDRFSYIGNSETGVGQITSHKRRVSRISAGTAEPRFTVSNNAIIDRHEQRTIAHFNLWNGTTEEVRQIVEGGIPAAPQGAGKP